MDATADEATVHRVIERVRSALESSSIPIPASGFWNRLEREVRSALERNDERKAPVRDAIESWIGRKALRDPNFAIDHSLETAEDVAIQLEFSYHKENRSIASAHEPYRRQAVGSRAEGVWDRSVSDRFTPKSYSWTRAGSGQVIPCPQCRRTGKSTCGTCAGYGFTKAKCGKCDGEGEIERKDTITGGTIGKKAGLGAGIVLRKEHCHACEGTGKLNKRCAQCKGHGEVTCTLCEGVRDLWQYQIIQAEVTVATKDLLIRPDDRIAPKWIAKVTGNPAIIEGLFDDAANKNRQLIPELTSGQLLYERISLSVVPITFATFEWRNRQRKVYLVDGQFRSRETGAFLDKRRVAAAVGVSSSVLLITGWLGFTVLTSSGLAFDRGALADSAISADAFGRAVVIVAGANIRAGNSTDYRVVGQVLQGDTLEITGEAVGGWLPVRSAEGAGFINQNLIQALPPQ